ncbi:lamin tail domain-containing protein, partial [Candidatus Poribacteria bacterium]|nr:lamin tail domain-containing protein [Candidatus Poribacteria bacterium]
MHDYYDNRTFNRRTKEFFMKMIVTNRITVIVILILTCFCFITEDTYSEVTISEIMYGSVPRFTPHQWIEISNSGSKPVDMTGWKLIIQNADMENLVGPLTATIVFEDEFWGDAPALWNNETLLVVTDEDSNNSGGFMDDQVFALRWRGGLDISFWDTFMSGNGFLIQLIDKDGNVIDQAGNYDGNTVLWNLPYYYNRGRIRAGNRTSLLRLYDNGTALDGTLESSWVSAADASLLEVQKTFYGDEGDISSVGILGPNTIIEIPPEPPMVEDPSKPINISEIMYGSESRFTPPQWIEISNNGSEP